MVAYSFKKRFVPHIESGRKRHTMRNDRKRHARPGEIVQLYYAQRTKQCRRLGTPDCVDVQPVRIDFKEPSVQIADWPKIAGREALNEFAWFDGFDHWGELVAFWDEEHGAPDAWSGVIIYWVPLSPTS